MDTTVESDCNAIRALISRQFASISWKAAGEPDWEKFRSDFFPDAQMFPSSRPARPQSIPAFIKRMSSLAGSDLLSLDERVLGSKIQVFGNVAVAVIACENVENEINLERVVEMMLLVKDQGNWKIAAQAWDKAGEDTSLPTDILD
ncbi:nuclear transport factor 2 family protein [Mesorhizobium sp. M0924]|uniref:nuclear transport factor 2 family protein n=1 Tax=unclassified Mesorhizobium TaxID=325217 RepID=UPI003337DDC9